MDGRFSLLVCCKLIEEMNADCIDDVISEYNGNALPYYRRTVKNELRLLQSSIHFQR